MAALLERMWAGDASTRPSADECAAEVRAMAVRAPLCAAGVSAGCALQ